jgi:non-ribosomal peptide synthetase component F
MPDAPAVSAKEVTLSYWQFDGRANRLAHLLRERGFGSGDLMAVCLDRTVDVPVSLAGDLESGSGVCSARSKSSP